MYSLYPEAEFKEFEPRFKHGWFHLKLYLVLRDLSRRSKSEPVFGGSATRFNFFKFWQTKPVFSLYWQTRPV